MKLSKSTILLLAFIVISLIYGYGYTYETQLIQYLPIWLMSFLAVVYYVVLAFYYIFSADKVNKLFLLALFFALSGDLLFFNKANFAIGLGAFVFFILLNMLIVSKKIGEIKIATFFITIIPFLLILMLVLSIFFSEVGMIKLLFLTYGCILGLYASFSLYYYVKKKHFISLLNLVGVLCLIVATVIRGLRETEGHKTTYRLLNITFYTCFLLIICYGYVLSDSYIKQEASPN